MNDRLLDELEAVASEAAAAASELIHERRPRDLEVAAKSGATDLVTSMDRASERLIRSVIGARRPDDVVIGEEGGDGGATGDREGPGSPSGVRWWVDPIDGTTNYVYDHPGYNVSIAAELDGEVVVGVVADPTHGRTYRAVRGRGARCDDRVLRLGPAPPLELALVATGFAYDRDRRARQGRVAGEVVATVRDLRRMGAAALDLCSVAAGRVDAYYEVGLSMWDLAAGALVATEAGARAGSIDGGSLHPGSVLVTHPERFDELSEVLVGLGAERV